MNNTFSVETLMASLPDVLSSDKTVNALAYAASKVMAKAFEDTIESQFYTRIYELDEETLDAIAKGFGIGWYVGDASLEEKRQTVAESWYVHRHLGTKTVIEMATRGFAGESEVLEWWEYGGQPGHYKVILRGETANLAAQQTDEIMRVIRFVERAGAIVEYEIDLGIDN